MAGLKQTLENLKISNYKQKTTYMAESAAVTLSDAG